ncbi:uncharacterized protein LODBEIA_P33550 [Lodderomyces beijingensis]|uniref:Amino acid transporter transmembrane domain-containing protein n=1 Tax=Lodderomyces beijingensis TaxID=1775926 RepID=A0ABP0ZLV5_9ASCO
MASSNPNSRFQKDQRSSSNNSENPMAANHRAQASSPSARSSTPMSSTSPRGVPPNPYLNSKPNSNSNLSSMSGQRPRLSSSHRSHDSSSSTAQDYDDHISQINVGNSYKNIDLNVIGKHLVSPEDSLKQQGGDITRRLYHQMENVSESPGHSHGGEDADSARGVASGGNGIAIGNPKRRTRSTSFSALEDARRGSTASDINVPGGFRREFIIQKSLKKNEEPPNFLTKNFMEFLSIYGHFAGEDFSDDDDDASKSFDDASLSDSTRVGGSGDDYEDVFDEDSNLLLSPTERRGYGSTHHIPKQLPPRREPPPRGTATVAKTFFLVFKALVGSGVLFLPKAFYNGGLLFSIITLSLFGFLTYFCYIVLIQSKQVLKLTSFGELGYKTYGAPLKYSILVSILLSQIGFVATYILFTAENMIAFIEQFVSTKPEWLNRANVVIVQCVLMIPLVLIRNLTKLSLVSLISSGFIIIGLLIIFWFSGLKIYLEGVGPNIENFNPNSWTMLIGVAVTSFEGIGLILPIEASMAEPEKFPIVLSVSMAVITAIFVAIGAVGYTAFGDKVKSIVILNLPQGNIAVQSILFLYSIAVFLSAPLQLFPAIKIGESVLFRHRGKQRKGETSSNSDGKLYHHSGKHNPQVKWLKNGFRALFVVAIAFIAFLNANNIDKFVSFNGCFACIPLVYIYPPLIHLRSLRKKEQYTTADHWLPICDYTLIIVGIATVIYSSYQIIFLN